MKKLFLLILILASLQSLGQKQGNIWYFGDHAGLDFSSGNPIPLYNGAIFIDTTMWGHYGEGTSAISDSAGNLLFYTDGERVWNNLHQIMPNGDSLLGHWSSTQSSLIVPLPGSQRFFYLFTTDAFIQPDFLKNGFRYNVIDMCLDNGRGDIVSNEKNIKLVDTVAEKLIGVRHQNGNDYWIVTHKFFSNKFYSFRLSSGGLVDTIISSVGSIHQDSCTLNYPDGAIGQLKSSPDGTKLALAKGNTCNDFVELFDFDNSTGIVSNPIRLLSDSTFINFYGVSFSPDNNKLYIGELIATSGDKIFQFDLTLGSAQSIINSKTVIASSVNVANFFKSFQLAPNGKIYIALNHRDYLSAIDYPNNPGLSCNFNDTAVSLGGRFCSYGLPNFIDSYSYSNNLIDCGEGFVEENNIHLSIYPNPAQDELTVEVLNGIAPREIEIVNALGVQGLKLKIQRPNTQVNIHSFPVGIYFVKVKMNDGSIQVMKFVKQ